MKYKLTENIILGDRLIKNGSVLSVEELPSFVVYDPYLNSEAEYISLDNIKVGHKFFQLDIDSQKHVLLHEIGHHFSDKLLKNGVAFDWQDNGLFIGDFNNSKVDGINGQYKPGENVAEAFAVFIDEPEFLKKHYIALYKELENTLDITYYKRWIDAI